MKKHHATVKHHLEKAKHHHEKAMEAMKGIEGAPINKKHRAKEPKKSIEAKKEYHKMEKAPKAKKAAY